MNSRDTACLSVAAALALSALVGDARADQATVPPAPEAAAQTHGAKVTRVIKAPAKHRASRSAKSTKSTKAAQLPPAAGASTAFDAAVAPLLPPVLAPISPAASPLSGLAGAEPSSSEPAGADTAAAALAQARAAGAEPAPGTSSVRRADETPAQGDALAAAARLLGEGAPLDLLQSVIVPAARGVTIAEIQTEGEGAVTLSVRPTKITRGSGLVATGKF